MKVLGGFLLSLALLITGITPATARELNKDFQESFPVTAGARLHLVHGDGDVTIEPWDKDELDVKVRYHVQHDKIGLGSDPEFEVEFRQDDKTTHVIGREKGVVVIGFSSTSRYEYTYTIHAPAYLELDLDGDDGDVRISGWRGVINAVNDDGDIELQGCRFSTCDVESQDGDIIIRDSAGDFGIKTQDGDVQFRRCRAGKISVATDDGEIRLDLQKHDALDLYARSGDGDILVEVEPGTSATFTIETEDGEIELDVPASQITAHNDEKASGTLAGGDGRIKIKTDDGTVRLRGS